MACVVAMPRLYQFLSGSTDIPDVFLNDLLPNDLQTIMELKQQQKLVDVHRQLALALMGKPSHHCKNCKVLAKALSEVTVIYADIMDGVIKKEIRTSFARRMLATIVDIVKAYTKGS